MRIEHEVGKKRHTLLREFETNQEILQRQFATGFAGMNIHLQRSAPGQAELDKLGALYNEGRFLDLEFKTRSLIQHYPQSGFLWKALTTSLHMQGVDPLPTMQKAAVYVDDDVEVHYNLGYLLQQKGRLPEAEAAFLRALEIKPDFAQAHNDLGTLFQNTNRLPAAEAAYQRALELKPDSAVAFNNLGYLYQVTKRLPEAEAAYLRALELKPDYAETYYNLGYLYHETKRLTEAEEAYGRALELKPDYAEVYNNLGTLLHEAKLLPEAEKAYRRALELKPDYAEGYNNLGSLLQEAKHLPEAEAIYRLALELKPDDLDTLISLGNLFHETKRLIEAEAAYRHALEIKPDFAEAHYNLGNVLKDGSQFEGAMESYRRLLDLKPDFPCVYGDYLYSKMQCCNWEGLNDAFHKILVDIDANKPVSTPFILLTIPATLAQQKTGAQRWVRDTCPEVPTTSNVNDKYSHDKIRLGYFSSDFYNHATAHLMAELLEQHDRSKFEVIGISFGASPDDTMRQRLNTAFDRFIDVHHQSDAEICALARSLEIDIAIDLKGFTGNARTGIFALRPAPVQVNYLGYPGTMGAPYMDYLIADPTLIPLEHQPYYTEKIAYLPDSYQVNDSHRQISARLYTRSEVGLPEAGFVFCCFNNNYKITPVVFDIWMQLLKQVEGSVLWLYEGNPWATQNLLSEAAKRGVAPERLVFAKRMDLPEHLARHRLADLFLDTFYCNAHTTASDALWAGLPVLTLLGDTFAGRVAASLLNAIGLPELITHTHDEYKTLALALATQPDKLALLRQQLAKNRTTQPLFNTERYTRHIEEAYTRMWQRHQEALVPEHMYVGKVNE